MRIVFATGNRGKLAEAAEILGPDFELVIPADLGIDEDIPETGSTLKENSLQKASYIWEKTGLPCFADDTGLEVDCLGGAPGVYTARYAGEHCNFDDNMAKLLHEMQGTDDRSASFRCVVTLIMDGEPHFFEGEMRGRIAEGKSGTRGFGYDPVFIPDEYPGRTLAEIPLHDKDLISHRGKALRAMEGWLAK